MIKIASKFSLIILVPIFFVLTAHANRHCSEVTKPKVIDPNPIETIELQEFTEQKIAFKESYISEYFNPSRSSPKNVVRDREKAMEWLARNLPREFIPNGQVVKVIRGHKEDRNNYYAIEKGAWAYGFLLHPVDKKSDVAPIYLMDPDRWSGFQVSTKRTTDIWGGKKEFQIIIDGKDYSSGAFRDYTRRLIVIRLVYNKLTGNYLLKYVNVKSGNGPFADHLEVEFVRTKIIQGVNQKDNESVNEAGAQYGGPRKFFDHDYEPILEQN